MYGVMRNIARICTQKTLKRGVRMKKSVFVSPFVCSCALTSLAQVVVRIVADGHKKVHPRA